MSKAVVVLGVVALGVAGAAVLLQHEDNKALRRELALLRTEMQLDARAKISAVVPDTNVAEPRAEHASPGAANDELSAVRKEMATLRKTMQELTSLAQTAQTAAALKTMSQSESSVATKLVPVTQWKNAGKGTPEAATETALWAAVGGDVETLANSFAFTPSSRAKADAWFATLSEETRRQYGSAENVFALLIARDAANLTGMQVLGSKEVTPNDVGLRIRFASGDKTKDDTFLMHRSTDGWRMMLPDQAIDSFAKKLSGKR